MTHDISKLKPITKIPKFDLNEAKELLVIGIIIGTITNLYEAVEITGASSGSQIIGMLQELKTESDMLSAVADSSAAEGKTIINIVKDIDNAATNFNGTDIKTMKVEVYGSVPLWKEAMTSVVKKVENVDMVK